LGWKLKSTSSRKQNDGFYIPDLIAKGLVLEARPSKIEVSWVLGISNYLRSPGFELSFLSPVFLFDRKKTQNSLKTKAELNPTDLLA